MCGEREEDGEREGDYQGGEKGGGRRGEEGRVGENCERFEKFERRAADGTAAAKILGGRKVGEKAGKKG